MRPLSEEAGEPGSAGGLLEPPGARAGGAGDRGKGLGGEGPGRPASGPGGGGGAAGRGRGGRPARSGLAGVWAP